LSAPTTAAAKLVPFSAQQYLIEKYMD